MLLLKVTKGKSYIILRFLNMLQASAMFSQVYVAPLHRVSTRHEQQAELMEQNQNLMAAKEELQKNLTETQVKKANLIKYS